MALPVGVQTVTVNIGPYLDHSGNPQTGRVSFTAPTDVVHLASGTQLVPVPVEVDLGPSGSGSVVLAATDDPGLAPTDFTYTVSFSIKGTKKQTTSISLPAAAPVVDLELLTDVPASSGLVVASPAVLSVNGQTGAVTGLATSSDISAAITAERTSERAHQDGTFATLTGLAAETTARTTGLATKLDTATAATTYEAKGEGFRGFVRPRRAVASVLTQFDTGHGWDMGGTGWASKSIGDTADFVTGTQSFRWATNGTGNLAYMQKTGLALDLTDKQVRVWFKVDDFANIGNLQLIAGASGLASYYWGSVLSAVGTEKFRLYKNGDWAHVTFIPDMMNVVGSPTRSAIDTMRLIVQDNAAGTLTVRVDRIEIIAEGATFPSGVVSLCFDDSYLAAYTVAQPKLSQYGYLGTLFPVPGDLTGSGGKMSQAQLDKLAHVMGWEVGAHAMTGAQHALGLDGMTSAQRLAELTALRQWQRDHGYVSDSFAWPNGSWDAASEVELRQFYATARVASRDFHETQSVPQPYRVKAINPTSQTLAQMQNEIAKCKTAATWCIFLFHDIVTAKSAPNDVATADFQALVDYINTQGVPVRTIGEVTRALAV